METLATAVILAAFAGVGLLMLIGVLRRFLYICRPNEIMIFSGSKRVMADGSEAVQAVDVTGCIHLKTAVTAVSDSTVLVNPAWVDRSVFAPLVAIEVDPTEPMGANVVRVGAALVYGEAYPRTRARLEARGFSVHSVDASELAKAEGAVTCCSLVMRA